MKSKIAIAVALIVGASAAPASAAEYRNCGSNVGEGWTYGPTTGAGNFNVKARKVACRKARYIVTAHGRWEWWHNADYSRMEWYRGPWTCQYRTTGYESGKLSCLASHGRRVRWVTGA
jgi:hypothetical protein